MDKYFKNYSVVKNYILSHTHTQKVSYNDDRINTSDFVHSGGHLNNSMNMKDD